MLFSISWRNVWRNQRRSLVMIISITLGICAGIFLTAFYQGMADQRIAKAINTEISHIQIHQPEFRQSNDITKFMPDADELRRKIKALPEVQGVSERLVIFSMIASAETGSGVKILGIHPEEEKQATNLHTKITQGNYFEEDRRNAIVIGDKLAETLKVKLGSKVVLTLQDVDNNITAGAFRIVGIFNSMNSGFDESNVFVRYQDLARLINIPQGAAHEIAVLAKENSQVAGLEKTIQEMAPKAEVLSWMELSPEMSYLNDAMDLYMYIFIVIILVALLFGIINTMLMAVLDRVKEIGMLMAIGMNKLRIFGMIVLETVFLSLTGGILGVILGSLISKYFETHSIDLSMWGEVYTSIGYDPFVYTHVEWPLLINVTLLVILTGILAAIYPAFKALQNDPADALRME